MAPGPQFLSSRPMAHPGLHSSQAWECTLHRAQSVRDPSGLGLTHYTAAEPGCRRPGASLLPGALPKAG
jgi:hypothetical protein